MKVYILESHDDWNESHYIRGVFATKEAAIAYMTKYDDVVYDKRRDSYDLSDPDSSRYFTISEWDVRN